MTNGSISFVEQSLGITRNFLHTVVVVDDEAGYRDVTKERLTPGLKKPDKSDASGEDSRVLPPHKHPLNAKILIDTFAELGMVCAILKPEEDEDFSIKTDHASQRADIVILDWRIGDDYGNKTTEAIKKIIETDNGRLRLIVIYSGENLDGIFSKLVEIENSAEVDEEEKKITFGNVRLILLAKELTEQNDFPHLTCSENELPTKVTDAFRDFTMGLLSNAALKSISLIRSNSHRLLTHFRPELDSAFLTHRALTTPPDESEAHIAPLFLDEMCSILNNEKIGEQVNLDAIKAWIDYQSNMAIKYRKRLHIHNNENDAKEKLLELLNKGCDELVKELKLRKEKAKGNWELMLKNIFSDSNKIHDLTSIWANQDNAEEVDKQFAYQMITNRVYRETLPMLKLGTIVQLKGSKKLFLCVQPLCDCVRIDSEREFTFLRLRDPKQHSLPELLIQTAAGFRTLYVDYKPFQSCKISFKADENKKYVLSKKSNDDYIFNSVENTPRDFEFITELKSQIAHRILAKYGSEVSRLGLTESEWLRRSARG